MSARRVEEAKVQVEVPKEYTEPAVVTARAPCESPWIVTVEVAVSVPTIKFPAVVEARYERVA